MRPNGPAVFYILNMILMVESMTASGTNLQGQMFTLPRYDGGVSLYPPSLYPSSPSPSWTPYTTSYWPWKTTTPGNTPPPTTTLPPTTVSPRRGVSVCVRYMTEDGSQNEIFTLSRDSSRMVLSSYGFRRYQLTLGYSHQLTFTPSKQLWPSVSGGLWTSVCVIVDTRKGVAQVFREGAMSIRKRLSTQYVWTGAPVIDISNFEGQLTDVQVWGSSLSNHDVLRYMTYAQWGYRGSALTWFDISYSLNGNALLEEAYDMQGSISQKTDQPIRGQAGESARLTEKRRKRLFRKQGRKDRKREWL